jgi:nucleoside-diphosphate-sugar epimerase
MKTQNCGAASQPVRLTLQCQAIVRRTVAPPPYSQVPSVECDQPSTFLELVQTISAAVEGVFIDRAKSSPERKAQESSNFYDCITMIHRLIGWRPSRTPSDGVRRTVGYLRRHQARCW